MTILAISENEFLVAKTSSEKFIDGYINKRSRGYSSFLNLQGDNILLRIYSSPSDEMFFLEGEPAAYHPVGVLANGDLWLSCQQVDSMLSDLK